MSGALTSLVIPTSYCFETIRRILLLLLLPVIATYPSLPTPTYTSSESVLVITITQTFHTGDIMDLIQLFKTEGTPSLNERQQISFHYIQISKTAGTLSLNERQQFFVHYVPKVAEASKLKREAIKTLEKHSIREHYPKLQIDNHQPRKQKAPITTQYIY